MTISVIIPHFNQTQFLQYAVDSIIQQTYPASEIIVVDDGSTESLKPFLASHGHYIKLIHQNNAGSSAARNRGIKEAKGEFVAFLDADDIWHAEKLALQIQFLANNPHHMVFCHTQNFLCNSLSEALKEKLKYNEMNPIPGLAPSSLIIAKQTILDIGLMNESTHIGEFIEWYIQAKKIGIASQTLPQTLVYRRIHAGHLGKSHLYHSYLKILHQKIKQKSNVND